MPTVTIDGQTIEVEPGTVILEAAKRLGISIPHFCWHEALRPAGNCRICLVEANPARGPVIACMTACSDGMTVQTQSELAVQSQNAVMEFLLLNHPLDCSICDQAGECKLQRYSYDYGGAASRLDLEKVKKPKAVPFSEHILFDAERCILCTRCIRFFEDVRGKSELGLVHRGTFNEVAVAQGKTIEDNYSMNIIDICPVGALTSQDFRFRSRVWFLEQSDSICPGCSKGCNTKLSTKDDQILRVVPRVNAKVNGHWMCDAGRFVGDQVRHEDRLASPSLKTGHGREAMPWNLALDRAAELLENAKGRIQLVASTQASLEDLYLFRKLSQCLPDAKLSRVTRRGEADDFLVTADRTPNSAGADLLGFPSHAPSGSGGWIVLGDDLAGAEPPSDLDFLITLGWMQTELHEEADVSLPLAFFGEVDQTYLNQDQRLQLARRAVDPWEDSLPGFLAIQGLLRRLDSSLPRSYPSAEALFQEMQRELPELKKLVLPRMLRLPPLGVSLVGDDPREAV